MRLLAALVLAAALLPAAIEKIYLEERGDYGATYERVLAKAHFAIDPKLPANRVIADLEYAPVDADGLVRFTADLLVIKPRNPATGSGTLLFEVSNRGGRSLQGLFGDEFLMKLGHTLVWVGWQWDVPLTPGLLRLYPPRARGIEAIIRSEFVPRAKVNFMNLGDRNMQAYPADGPVKLTIRDTRDGRRQELTSGWQLNADRTGLELAAGFQPYQIYEAIYTTKDPVVAGTGLAAIRDLVSFLRYTNNGVILLGDQPRHIKRTIAFGSSQSGRLLRQFLYDGFNIDEKGRPVFDGIWANVAGAGRGSFNRRGAQPSRDGHPTFNFFYPTDLFPYTDLPQTDPVTKTTDGLLRRANDPAPRIFYTNGSYEYWGRNAALIHITPDGKRDAPLAPNTRIYFVAGSQHSPGLLPPPKEGNRHPANMNDYRPLYRALLVAMEEWIRDNRLPPPSQYPRLSQRQLIPFESYKEAGAPTNPMRAWRVDYTQEPPTIGQPFPLLVPALGPDGNELGGVRMPEVAVPLARYRGWNFVADPAAPRSFTSDMTGSTLPFTAAQIQRLHGSKEAYSGKVKAAAEALVDQRLLLESDVPAIVDRAGAAWDWAVAQKP
jgi:hypothetical protein